MEMENEIVQKGEKVLRKVAKAVPIEDIKSRRVETIIRRMIKAVENQEDGVAIAAPQIGENLRIFVISKKIFEIMAEEKINSRTSKREKLETFEEEQKGFKNLVFINPEILKISKKKMLVEEGCLSVRWLYGKVSRSEKTLVKAYDENGKLFTMGGSGLLSQAFQHEIDHLDGILFTDKASDIKEIPPQKVKKI
jgi:peptide deformylase